MVVAYVVVVVVVFLVLHFLNDPNLYISVCRVKSFILIRTHRMGNENKRRGTESQSQQLSIEPFFRGLSSGLKLIKYSKSRIRKNANVIHCATSFNEFINTRTEFIAHAIYAHGMRPRPLTIRLCHIHYAALISTFESSFLFHYASSVVVPFRTYALALAFFSPFSSRWAAT